MQSLITHTIALLIGTGLGWYLQVKFGSKVTADTARLTTAVTDLKETVDKL